jgi:antitoxin (DNA-binding transcriptional repressor) of toxin-antitoxin stability system
MTVIAHAYELPPDAPGLDEAVADAARGEVVYLTRRGEQVAAVVPLSVTTTGSAAVEALEDAEAAASVADQLA